jgi:hypothetical protein
MLKTDTPMEKVFVSKALAMREKDVDAAMDP